MLTLFQLMCTNSLCRCKIIVNLLRVAIISSFEKFCICFTSDFFVSDVIDSLILGIKTCFTLKLLKRINVLSESVSLTLLRIYSEYG